jgi:hypothetical protein
MEMVCNPLSGYLPCYVTAYGNCGQPLMEMVGNCWSSYLPCYATTYGNGVNPPKIPRTAAPILKKG